MINRKLTGKTYHQYINPERESEEGALKVHGIQTEFLKTQPLFSEIIDDFMRFIDGAQLIIHNAPFDVGFLNHELTFDLHAILVQFWKNALFHISELGELLYNSNKR